MRVRRKVYGVRIRGLHPNSYRPGEWAAVVGVVFVAPDELPRRLCYLVQYGDGMTDMIAVDDRAGYELAQE